MLVSPTDPAQWRQATLLAAPESLCIGYRMKETVDSHVRLLGKVEVGRGVGLAPCRLEIADDLLEQRQGGEESNLLLLGALNTVFLRSDCAK